MARNERYKCRRLSGLSEYLTVEETQTIFSILSLFQFSLFIQYDIFLNILQNILIYLNAFKYKVKRNENQKEEVVKENVFKLYLIMDQRLDVNRNHRRSLRGHSKINFMLGRSINDVIQN